MVFRRIAKVTGVVILLCLTVGTVLFMTTGIPVSLNRYRDSLQDALTKSLHRRTEISGNIDLVISRNPSLRISDLVVCNPENWKGKTTRVAFLRQFLGRISLRPLLQRKLEILDLEVKGLDVTLEEESDGLSNWASPKAVPESAPPKGKSFISGLDPGGLRNLEFRDIRITHYADGSQEPARYLLVHLRGSSDPKAGMDLDAKGTFRDEPFELDVTSGSLAGFLERAPDWPVNFRGNLAGLTVEGKGATGGAQSPEGGYIDFHIGADQLEELAAVLDTSLPPLGHVDLSGRIRDGKGGLFLENLEGMIGETSLSGNLLVDHAVVPPRVDGELLLGTVDVDTLSSGKKQEKQEEEEAPTGIKFPITGKLRLGVEEVINPRTSVEDVIIDCEMTQSTLKAAMTVKAAGVPMTGTIEIKETAEGNVDYDIEFFGENDEIAGLFELYTGNNNVSGPFKKVRFHNYNEGPNLGDAMKSSFTELEIENADLVQAADGSETAFYLEEGSIRGQVGKPTHHRGVGTFRGARFDATYIRLTREKAGPDDEAFFEVFGTIAEAKFSLAGKYPRDESAPLPPRKFSIEAEKIGTLAPLVGVPESATLPLRVGGLLARGGENFEITELKGKLGQSNFSGTVKLEGAPQNSLYSANLDLDTVNVAEINALLGKTGANPGEKENAPGLDLDKATLPTEVKVDNLDLDLRIAEILLGKNRVRDFTFIGKTRDGRMETSPFTIRIGEESLEGVVSADFSGTDPEVTVELKATDLDVGFLLAEFDVAENIELEVGSFGLHLHAKGETLREGLLRSEIRTHFEDGVWILKDPNTGARLPLILSHGVIEGTGGEGLLVRMDGSVQQEPLRIEIRTDALTATAKDEKECSLSLHARVADTRADLEGTMGLPLEGADMDMKLAIAGRNFSSLNGLLKTDLPPLGPYDLKGRFQLVDEGYSLSGLNLKVGSSDLRGDVRIDTKTGPPFLFMNLSSNTVQLDDFLIKGWSPKGPNTSKPAASGKKKAPDPSELNRQLDAANAKLNELLSPRILGKFDANISVRTGKVLSGRDKLGGGALKMVLDGEQLTLDPIDLSLPRGNVKLSYHYHPGSKTYSGLFRVRADDLDYGYLARRIDSSSDAGGVLDLDVEIRGKGIPINRRILQHGSGHFDFVVHPRNMNAKVFDLWATNLIIALLPTIDPKKQSKMNFMIGEFDLSRGVLAPRRMIMDTTKVRAEGTGTIDVRGEQYDLRFVPKPKKPQILSLETRIGIEGTFDDPKIKVGDYGPAGVVLRSIGNTLAFPIRAITLKRLPSDGSDIDPE